MNEIEKYTEAMRLVGGFPAVEGVLRTLSVVLGFVGIMALLAVVFFTSFLNPEKHIVTFCFLLIVFATMFVLPLYYPH